MPVDRRLNMDPTGRVTCERRVEYGRGWRGGWGMPIERRCGMTPSRDAESRKHAVFVSVPAKGTEGCVCSGG